MIGFGPGKCVSVCACVLVFFCLRVFACLVVELELELELELERPALAFASCWNHSNGATARLMVPLLVHCGGAVIYHYPGAIVVVRSSITTLAQPLGSRSRHHRHPGDDQKRWPRESHILPLV